MRASISRTVTITALLAGLAAGCSSAATTSPRPQHSNSTGTASPPAEAKAGQVGDKFTVTGHDSKYDVTLLSVQQPAQPESEFLGPKAGHHLAAAQFRVTAVTATDENSNLNATATGSNDESYSSALTPVTAGTNFASGAIRLQPGASLTGWVSFEVPDGVQLTRVQWTPSAGLSANRAEWHVNTSTAAPSPAPASPAPSPTGAPSPVSPPGAGTPGQTSSPAGTVIGYFDAINLRDYSKAWDLGGKNSGSGSYASFVRGFATTSMVSVQVLGTSGDTVTARITSLETDGSSKVFQGTYTVQNGVITRFSVRQVS